MEFTNHFLLPYSLFLKERQVLMNETRDIDKLLIDQNENFLCYTLLFGKQNMNDNENSHVLNATIEYILVTERLYLNKSKPLQLITTTIINDSILFELNTTFLFIFIYSIASQIYQANLYLEIVFVCTIFYRFYFCFVCIYVIIQTVHVYMYEQKKNIFHYFCQWWFQCFCEFLRPLCIAIRQCCELKKKLLSWNLKNFSCSWEININVHP